MTTGRSRTCPVPPSTLSTTAVTRDPRMLGKFQLIISADEIGAGKPAPDVYLHAAELLYTPPVACLALDDSPAGVQAASTAGMCAIGVGGVAASEEPSLCFPDLLGVSYRDLENAYQSWVQKLYAVQNKGMRDFPRNEWE